MHVNLSVGKVYLWCILFTHFGTQLIYLYIKEMQSGFCHPFASYEIK